MSCSKLFDLTGRVALVTGAVGYLGRAMVAVLADAGATVVLNDKNEKTLKEFTADLNEKNIDAYALPFDITNKEECLEAFDAFGRKWKRLDVIINNAYSGPTGTVDTASIGDFENAYSHSVTAPFYIVQQFRPLLKKTAEANIGGASVINIASMYGMVSPDPAIYGDSGQNSPPFYGAAKAGLIQLTRYLACHLASENIRVNSISPGPFPKIDKKSQREFYLKLCRKNPMNRVGCPDELRGPVLFLASDASSFVTGINLPVDGGWTAW